MNIDYEKHSDPEIEYSLLANYFHKPENIFMHMLSFDDWYYEINRNIHEKICKAMETMGAVDYRVMYNQLTDDEKEYMESAIGMIAVDDAMAGYIEVVQKLARKRRVLERAQDIIFNQALDTQELEQMLTLPDDGKDTGGIKSSEEIFEEIFNELGEPRKCHPIKHLDKLTDCMSGGLYEGYTYGFCGAEKAGKTTMAHSISYGLDCPHMYIAMEMGSKQIEQRNLARDMGVNSLEFLSNPQNAKKKMTTIRPQGNRYYLDAAGASLDDILHSAMKGIHRFGIKGFIVDYWQLISCTQKNVNEEKHLRDCAQGLANFARKNNVWCILLAQMNQDGRLFGGNGLRKACDQLYMIEQVEGFDRHRWLRMDASRYTMKKDIGSEENPCLEMGGTPFFFTN